MFSTIFSSMVMGKARMRILLSFLGKLRKKMKLILNVILYSIRLFFVKGISLDSLKLEKNNKRNDKISKPNLPTLKMKSKKIKIMPFYIFPAVKR